MKTSAQIPEPRKAHRGWRAFVIGVRALAMLTFAAAVVAVLAWWYVSWTSEPGCARYYAAYPTECAERDGSMWFLFGRIISVLALVFGALYGMKPAAAFWERAKRMAGE